VLPVSVPHEARVDIEFQNTTNPGKPLYFTVFDLQPLWGISRIYPSNAFYEAVPSGSVVRMHLAMSVPEQLGEVSAEQPPIMDTLKAFVTSNPTSFEMFQSDDIDLTTMLPGKGVKKGLHDYFRDAKPFKEDEWWDTSEITIRTVPQAQNQ
jgi:hypothetical protein